MGSVPLRVSLDFDSECLYSIAMVLNWMSGGKRQVYGGPFIPYG